MDYPNRRRLKIFARVEAKRPRRPTRSSPRGSRLQATRAAERAFLLHLEAFDWNCPQHITPRFSEAELEPILASFRQQIERLEAENRELRAKLAS